VIEIPDQAPSSSATGLTLIRIAGPDRTEFLQGQLTQDVRLCTPDQPMLAGWPNAKGRLQCLAWLLNWQDTAWLLLPGTLAAAVTKRLSLYVLRSNVSVEVAPADVSFARPNSEVISNISDSGHCFYNDKFYSFQPISGDSRWLQIRLAESTDPDPEATTPWRLANINAGLPTVYPETAERFVPQMVNLDLLDGISFTKGCYIGQEIVARTQNLGRIKRRMYRWTAAYPTAPGAPIYAAGRSAGEVVDAVNQDGSTPLLAVARIESLGHSLSLDPAGAQPLRRERLPYPVPETLDV